LVNLSAWLQPYAGLVVPGLAILALIVLARFAKGLSWRWMMGITGAASLLMIGLTAFILVFAPKVEAAETEVAVTLADRILAGQELYSLHCVECHGDDGKVTVIEGVEGLEGRQVMAINATDVLYTLNDAALAEVIAYGRPAAGMNPFGKMYNPEGLGKSDIDNIVLFMRYMWDDRFEPPQEVLKPLIPELTEGEVPSYEVHIAPLVKRYCVSCHRAGKENNNYLMTTYEEILTTGDHVDNNLVKGEANSYFLQVIQGYSITENGEEIIGVMPPKTTLKASYIDVFLRWILAGMPMTAEDAAGLFVAPTPEVMPAP
jgi:mono/diheme cytochrome c family protein